MARCNDSGLAGFENDDPKIKKQVFKNMREAEKYLLNKEYHETLPLARWGKHTNIDFTRDLGDGNRFHAWIRQDRNNNRIIIESEGPEPNPEPTVQGILRLKWPVRAWLWHRKC